MASDTCICPCPYHLIPLCLIFDHWMQRNNSPFFCRWTAEHSDVPGRGSTKGIVTFLASLTTVLENNTHVCFCSCLWQFPKTSCVFHTGKASNGGQNTMERRKCLCFLKHMFLKADRFFKSITAVCLQSSKSDLLQTNKCWKTGTYIWPKSLWEELSAEVA